MSRSLKVSDPVLAVDLDGTLVRSDLLYECFWSALSRDWLTPFKCAKELFVGRAAMKRYLAVTAQIDVSTLPYNDLVIAYLKNWKDGGGRTVLVTASDQILADRIKDHLGLFDEVYGSDGQRNLKGEEKARFLTDHYNSDGFSYMGDSMADLHVWRHARKAISVDASKSTKDRIAALDVEVENLNTSKPSVWNYLRAMRPHQWVKNVLVLVPMLAAHELTEATIMLSFLAFVAFCAIASSVYVVNDLLDLAADRAHPRKRFRPFASGEVPVAHGAWMALGLFSAGAVVSLYVGWEFALVMLAYYAATTAYSFDLKRQLIIDVCTLAGLYTLRIIAGAVAAGVPLSFWLLAFSVFIFLSLAAMKRQAELVDTMQRNETKASGRGYKVEDLPIISMMVISAGYVSILILALYINSPEVKTLYAFPIALWGLCPIFLFWISRMAMLTHRGKMTDDPIVFAARDRVSQICLLAIAVIAVGGAAL